MKCIHRQGWWTVTVYNPLLIDYGWDIYWVDEGRPDGAPSRLPCTQDPTRAAMVRHLMDEVAVRAFEDAVSSVEDVPTDAPDDLSLYPFQAHGVGRLAWILNRHRGALLADEQGLGKTAQALTYARSVAKAERILVTCPASLSLNWVRECEMWYPELRVEAWGGGIRLPDASLVCSYTRAAMDVERLASVDWDLVICDEAHYLKNTSTKRSRAIRTILKQSDAQVILATGTPSPKSPLDLWSLLSMCSRMWRNRESFEASYIERKGLKIVGRNLDTLAARSRSTVMVRRRKAEVLPDLPPKRRKMLYLDADGVIEETGAMDEYERTQAEADWAKAMGFQEAASRNLHSAKLAWGQLARTRADNAVARAEVLKRHLKEIDEPAVVFCHHRELYNSLRELPSAGIAGGDKVKDRQEAVDAFQRGDVDLFVASLGAASTGITLTRASRLIIAEPDWSSATLEQAEDRIHRIGQQESCLIEYVCLEGTVDERILASAARKSTEHVQSMDVGRITQRLRDHGGAYQVALAALLSEEESPSHDAINLCLESIHG